MIHFTTLRVVVVHKAERSLWAYASLTLIQNYAHDRQSDWWLPQKKSDVGLVCVCVCARLCVHYTRSGWCSEENSKLTTSISTEENSEENCCCPLQKSCSCGPGPYEPRNGPAKASPCVLANGLGRSGPYVKLWNRPSRAGPYDNCRTGIHFRVGPSVVL
jgi:hypothetical protein